MKKTKLTRGFLHHARDKMYRVIGGITELSSLRGRRRASFFLLVSLMIGALGVSCDSSRNRQARTARLAASDPAVVALSGPSWLKHLGLVPTNTQMGRMGGTEPAEETAREEPNIMEDTKSGRRALRGMMSRFMRSYGTDASGASRALAQPFQLAGLDLYRLNCQSCHGPDGEGAPPEIKSLLDPVRGASATAIQRRMEQMGRSIPDQMARQLASQAEAEIRDRLAKGGEKMPSFTHLRGDEIDALLGYLGSLAGIARSKTTGMLVDQSAARVGEHLVGGTCHICHDATGPGGGHMAMMQGIIPSLASFPQQLSLSAVERQVHYGSPSMMMMMRGAAQMPPFPYLTEDEIAAGYFYLVAYPPEP